MVLKVKHVIYTVILLITSYGLYNNWIEAEPTVKGIMMIILIGLSIVVLFAIIIETDWDKTLIDFKKFNKNKQQ